jgi:ABC-2 type transport system ATP-binding protein
VIEVQNLTKVYGNLTAVDHISFRVNRGEILGFLGPNGAGKTTTMRILAGYLPATSGTARIAGYDAAEQSMEVRRRVGYLPEVPPLYPDMTVEGYLDFVARLKRVPAAQRRSRVTAAMELARVADRRRELIRRLSRGYRQRVGLAQAIVHDPDVLILDEPTAGLDPRQIIEVRQLIRSLAGNHTVVLSTHILPEVSMTCTRVVIINRGRVVAEDTPENLTLQLRGAERLRLLVRGPDAELRRLLQGLDGIRPVSITPVDDGQRLSLVLEVTAGSDVRPVLAKRLVQNGFELYELRSERMSLEEVFVQLTTEEPVEAAGRRP